MFSSVLEAYDEFASNYHAKHVGSAALVHKQFMAALGGATVATGRLLDVGIGTGLSSLAFKDHFDIYGVDGSKNMLGECAKENPHISEKNLRCVDLNKERLPFDDNYFSFTISLNSLFLIEQAVKVVKDMIRVTQKDGIIAFDMPVHSQETDEALFSRSAPMALPRFTHSQQSLDQIFENAVQIIAEKIYGDPDNLDTIEHRRFGTVSYEDVTFVLRKL